MSEKYSDEFVNPYQHRGFNSMINYLGGQAGTGNDVTDQYEKTNDGGIVISVDSPTYERFLKIAYPSTVKRVLVKYVMPNENKNVAEGFSIVKNYE